MKKKKRMLVLCPKALTVDKFFETFKEELRKTYPDYDVKILSDAGRLQIDIVLIP